ncbi:hypothetical protein DOTSEDRAFT_33711 [Dothistroma septosporum NZE10]|uniref:beta-glucosidase n=1 Tax=Dothistroma septosporum (strain NZE10 / CBS 128990) TaxID=675120 RepID=N1PS02_DOTSN|nr:hypothetical protein DOTSEDRAFT_33711 [Dothistroma septosporum NZE10]
MVPLTAKEKSTAVFGEDAGPNPSRSHGCGDRACCRGTNAMGKLIPTAHSNSGDRNNLTVWQGAEATVAKVTGNCNNIILVVRPVGTVEAQKWKDYPHDSRESRMDPSVKLPYTVGRDRNDLALTCRINPQLDFQEGVYIDYIQFHQADIESMDESGVGLSFVASVPFVKVQRSLRTEDRLAWLGKGPVQPGESVHVHFDPHRRDVSSWDIVSQHWQISEHARSMYMGTRSRDLPLTAALE